MGGTSGVVFKGLGVCRVHVFFRVSDPPRTTVATAEATRKHANIDTLKVRSLPYHFLVYCGVKCCVLVPVGARVQTVVVSENQPQEERKKCDMSSNAK